MDPDIALFVDVVQAGSLAGGARTWRLSPAMVSKRIARLEARLGVRLLHRTTRRLTMTEAHSWDVPEAILSGGRAGWPAILSGLKSLLETGRPLSIAMQPPPGMLEAVRQAVAEKPWLRRT